MVENWVFNNHWDTNISHYVLEFLKSVNIHRKTFLAVFIVWSSVAICNAIFMILGVCLQGAGKARFALLPWLIFDFITISITFVAFILWAFLSFFVHVLVAILFPILAGAILGLHIYLWRNVKDVYLIYADAATAVKVLPRPGDGRGNMYTMLHAPSPHGRVQP